MCRHVRVEVGYVAECLVADRALEGCRRGVGCLVLLQVRLLPKPFVTHQAFERPLTWESTKSM